MTHLSSVRLCQVRHAIWKRFARAVSNATQICATNPPPHSPTISTVGWKADPSKPDPFRHPFGYGVGQHAIQNWPEVSRRA